MNRNEFIWLLISKWRVLLKVFVIAAVLSVALSLVMPAWYRSSTTILPPVDDNALSGFSSLLSDLPLKALGLGGTISDQTNIFLAILHSRTLLETVAQKFNFIKIYKKKNLEDTIRELRKHVATYVNDEGTITLTTEISTPWFGYFSSTAKEKAGELTRDISNFIIQELDNLNKEHKTLRARNIRIFIEKRYRQNQEELAAAEEGLNKFQKKYGVISLPEQTEATIMALAEMKAKIVAQEVQLGVLKNYVGENHPEYRQAYNELNELQKKYNDGMRAGRLGQDGKDGQVKSDLYLKFDKVPDLILHNTRLLRDKVIQEKIMEFLLPQYEQAKIQEAKDTPTVQILDKAVTPLRKHRPKRALVVIFFTFTSVLVAVIYYYFQPGLVLLWQEFRGSQTPGTTSRPQSTTSPDR